LVAHTSSLITEHNYDLALAQRGLRAASGTLRRDNGGPAIDEPLATRFMFAKAGMSLWNVAFGGKQQTLRDLKGMGYLHQLLSRPNAPIHAWTLCYGTEPPLNDFDPLVDEKTLDNVRRQVAEKSAELEETHDQAKRDNLRDEIERLRSFITSTTTGRGKDRRPRGVRNDVSKARERVGKAIKAALKVIKQDLPTLHSHLEKTIQSPTGMEPCYVCPQADLPSWNLREDEDQGSAREA
jgi:hypothetical protein